MKDILVYHSAETMGYSALAEKDAVVVTNKRVNKSAIGDRIWLVTGEGRPRRYYLYGSFIITEIESAYDEGYHTRIWGDGKGVSKRLIEITDEPWFPSLRRSQGNFVFGYQTIKNPAHVLALKRMLRRHSH